MKTFCDPVEYIPCRDASNLIDAHLSRLPYPYSHAKNFRDLLTAYLQQLISVEQTLCLLLDNFRLESATGQQLDFIGQMVGLPRNVCNVRRVQSSLTCSPGEAHILADYTFEDDEFYRKLIRAMTYASAFDGTLKQYERIVQFLWDNINYDDPESTGTTRVLLHGGGVVNIAVNRDLTTEEIELVELYKYVLPFYGSYSIQVFSGSDFFRLGTPAETSEKGMCNPVGRGF